MRVRPNVLAPPTGAHADAAAAAPSSTADTLRSHDVRIALATLAVGSHMRCGFVRWCQSARRLRTALDATWHVDLVALRDASGLNAGGRRTLADPRDCPGLIEIGSDETESAARSCVRTLDAEQAVPPHSSPRNEKPRVVNLLKWALWSLEGRYDLIFYTDLDVDPMPAAQQPVARIRETWRRLVPKALNHPSLRIIASADSMAPVHGGLFLLRPSVAAYRRGIATLHACRWNSTHGWHHVGRPRSLVSFQPRHLDGSAMIRDVGSVNYPTSTDAFRWNDWSFWGGSVDQGLLWYEFFVRKGSGAHAGKRAAAGIYSRWSTAHKVTHEWGGDGKPWEAMDGGRRPKRRPPKANNDVESVASDVSASKPTSVSKLAIQLRYLMSIDLNRSSDERPSQCMRRLWRLRRTIENDPRFEAIWYRLAAAQNPTFSVW